MNLVSSLLVLCVAVCLITVENAGATPDSRSLILGGYDADTSRFPYFAGLLDQNGELYCGGTLVAPDVVLSAAHCWRSSLSSVAIGGDQREVIAVKSSTFHPGFKTEVLSHDILLVRLTTTSSQTPVRLNFDSNVPETKGTEINVIGKGITADANGHAVLADSLQQVVLDYVTNKECSNHGEKYHGRIHDDMICAGGSYDVFDFKGWYDGDSGGPLLLLGDSPEDDVQVGVVSFSAMGYPGVGSRTSANEDIIRNAICGSATEAPAYLKCDVPSEPAEAEVLSEPLTEETEGWGNETIQMITYASAGVFFVACSMALVVYSCSSASRKKKPSLEKSASFESTEEEENDETSSADKEILNSISALTKEIKNTKCDDERRLTLQNTLKAEVASLEDMHNRTTTTAEPIVVQMSPRRRRKSFDEALDMVLDIIEDDIL
jgi:Trypsin